MSSLMWEFSRQTTDAVRQTVFAGGKYCLRSASVGAKRISPGHPAPSEGALLLMRSVRSNKALLLTKVTKYCAQSENKRHRATFVFAGTVVINAEHLEHMSINS